MNKRYRFCNFFPQVKDIDYKERWVVKNFHIIHEVEADSPLRALNSYRKEQTHFDFLVENENTLLVANGIEFYKVDYDVIKEHYLKLNPSHLFMIEKAAFNQYFNLQ